MAGTDLSRHHYLPGGGVLRRSAVQVSVELGPGIISVNVNVWCGVM